MLSVIMPSVIMISVIMLSVYMLNIKVVSRLLVLADNHSKTIHQKLEQHWQSTHLASKIARFLVPKIINRLVNLPNITQ
jgi:hypothetical protein